MGFRELAHRSFAAGEVTKHPSARGIAECVKNRIQVGRC